MPEPADPRIPAPTDPAPGPAHGNTTGPGLPQALAVAAGQTKGLPYPLFSAHVTNITTLPDLYSHESSLAVAPDDETLIACAPTNTAPLSQIHVSHDGGATWLVAGTATSATDVQRSLVDFTADCDVAADAAGNLYAAEMTTQDTILVSSSSDAGASWTSNSLASGLPTPGTRDVRPWLAAGGPGIIHLVFEQVGDSGYELRYTKSTTQGVAFQPPVTVAVASGGKSIQPGQFDAAPDGTAIAIPYAVGGGTFDAVADLHVASSADGGATWKDTVVAATLVYHWPALSMDNGGILHLAWTGPGASPVMYATSTDGGATWAAPLAVIGGVSNAVPGVSGGAKGQAVIAAYGATDSPDGPRGYLHWARITGADQAPKVATATTTATPISPQAAAPEYTTVRLDSHGMMRVASAYGTRDAAGQFGWIMFYQAQIDGPPT
ncbi:MAG: glycoside hydrolase [Halobacteriales archaeon]|nr:glycoside hydrolase [Halobacteriales archaeon]